MNVGKSIRIALAMKGMKQKDLAEKLGIRAPSLSQLASQKSCTGDTISKLADAFDMPASEFIALGED